MKRRILALALTAALVSALSLPAAAADNTASADTATASESQMLPGSVLYYGEISEIYRDDNGKVTGFLMESEYAGELVVQVSDQTFWIDSGKQTASNPDDLKVGERLYVFHSPAVTASLPPQSAAYAVVRNIPMDASCAQYHEIEAVTENEDGSLRITTSNGGLYLTVDADTKVVAYNDEQEAGLDSLQPGNYAMFWYGAVALSYPGQAHPSTVMILPDIGENTLTGTEMVSLLQTLTGDVTQLSETAADNEPVTLEAFVTELWKMAGSPDMQGYWKLNRFDDAGKISWGARNAMRWADSNGLLAGIDGDFLNPDGNITEELAKEILAEYAGLTD